MSKLSNGINGTDDALAEYTACWRVLENFPRYQPLHKGFLYSLILALLTMSVQNNKC